MNDLSYNSNWSSMSDQALSIAIGRYIREHRLSKNISQQAVAKDAGISRSTLSLLEKGEPISLATLLRVLRVLDLLHVLDAFQTSSQPSPIAQAKMDREKRKRASKQKENEDIQTDW